MFLSEMFAHKSRAAYLRLFSLLAVSCFLPDVQTLSITKFSVPAAVSVGENAEIVCQYELKSAERENDVIVKWWWKPINGPQEDKTQLYQRVGLRKPNSIGSNISIKGNDTVLLLDLQPNNSGTYECEVSVSALEETRSHQKLVVFTEGSGTQLNVSTVADGDDADDEEDVLVECQAEKVAPEPELVITRNKEAVNVTQILSTLEKGFYSITANATLSQDDSNGATIRCELFFKDDTISHPEYYSEETYLAPGHIVSTETSQSDDFTTTEPATNVTTTDGATTTYLCPAALLLMLLKMFY